MSTPAIAISREELAAFCRKWHIHKLSLFGSVLRDDFGPASDVDVLVEFEPDHMPGWSIIARENEGPISISPQHQTAQMRRWMEWAAEVRSRRDGDLRANPDRAWRLPDPN